jgi:hypothetical protein
MRSQIIALLLMAIGTLAASPSITGTAAGRANAAGAHRQSGASQGARPASARGKSRPRPASVVFAVEEGENAGKKQGELALHPVVIIRRGRLVEPPSPDPSEDQYTPASARFAAQYFRPGKTYRLLFGGSEAATVRIVSDDRDTVNFAATARPVGRYSLRGPAALATDSAALGHLRPSRRAATTAQRRQAVAIAEGIFRRHGLPARSIRKMQVVNLTAGDLYGDGRTELIGSFQVPRRGAEQNLFVILEPRGNGFRASLVQYHPSKNPDREDAESQTLVDWLDLDGDGIAEVMTENSYYEAVDYAIYRKKAGRWRVIYQGGGSGV